MPKLRRPTGGLWDNSDFLKLWAGQSISEVGSQVSQFALPLLAALDLNCSPFQFALLGVLGFLPFILFALPAGVWVDRLHRRSILIVGDASRAVLLTLVPILWATHVLQMWHLLVLTFVIGVFTVFFDVAYQSYLPALIDREHLVDGNAKLQLTVSVAQVAGPNGATALVTAVTAPYAIIADAVSFVISTAFMLRMRHREDLAARTAGQPRSKMWPDVKEGLRWVVGHRWLRAIATCTGSANFFSSVLFSIGLLYMVRDLGMPKYQLGLVFGVGSAGAILGALLVNRLNKRIGVGPSIVVTAISFSLGGLGFALAPRGWVALPVLILAQALFGFGSMAYNISQVSLRQAITPERLQGRMNAAMRWIVWGTIPLGSLAGGAIASEWGLHAAVWVGAIGGLFTFLPVTLTSVRNIGEMPAPVEEPTPAQAEFEGGLVGGHPLPEPGAADL